MKIRRAGSHEATELTELAHHAKRHWGYPPEWMELWRDSLTISPDYLDEHDAFVAEIDDQIVGVCVLELHGDRGRLEHVWIHPLHQRQHIGRSLVEKALEAARNRGMELVEVLSDPFAEPFYRKLGAEKVGNRPAPMPGAMERTLPELEFKLGSSRPDRRE
jgi:N-acetylglutamate synthase-like GNAT family acetyltransferase